MTSSDELTQWILQLQSDQTDLRDDAARRIWQLYGDDLLKFARKRLGAVRRREDEEDVLQSVFKSFCLRQRRGQFDLAGRDDLWSVLVMITLRKVANAIARQARQRRDFRREVATDQGGNDDSDSNRLSLARVASDELSPDAAIMISEEMRRRLDLLPEPLQRVALWKLEGYTNEEIADNAMLGCATRTVERKIQRIRHIWRRAEDGPP